MDHLIDVQSGQLHDFLVGPGLRIYLQLLSHLMLILLEKCLHIHVGLAYKLGQWL
jgi:hypothetical protein